MPQQRKDDESKVPETPATVVETPATVATVVIEPGATGEETIAHTQAAMAAVAEPPSAEDAAAARFEAARAYAEAVERARRPDPNGEAAAGITRLGAAPHQTLPPVTVAPLPPEAFPPPGGGFAIDSNYVYQEKRILASTARRPLVKSETLLRTSVTAAADGSRILYKGTLLAEGSGGSAGYVIPLVAAGTFYGVLDATVDCRDFDQPVPVIVGNADLRSDRCIDDGVFGVIVAAHIPQARDKDIRFHTVDI